MGMFSGYMQEVKVTNSSNGTPVISEYEEDNVEPTKECQFSINEEDAIEKE